MKTQWIVGPLLGGLLLCGCRSPELPGLGEPLAGLTGEQRAQFEGGKKVFERVFVPDDGLGPLSNANPCAECHESPVLGGGGDEIEIHATRSAGPGLCDALFAEGGPVIQQDATPLLRALGILKEQIPAGASAQARRSSPPLFGFGLVDAIPAKSILAREDPDDANGDGISGRANRTIDGRVGRFGRKAAVAELVDFNSGAFPTEMGVTTPLSPAEETINGKPVPPETMLVAGTAAVAAQKSEVDQLKADLVGHTMGGREKCWKFQSVDQIKELVIKEETEHAQKRACCVALKLQAGRTTETYAAEARIEYAKAGKVWKLKDVVERHRTSSPAPKAARPNQPPPSSTPSTMSCAS